MATKLASAVLLSVLRSASAWGADGHTIVAHIADTFLDPEVAQILRTDLGQESLTDASDWADDYDHSAAGKWSAPLHYIDYPGQACSFDWSRDCQDDQCVTGAIVNFTKQLWKTSLPVKDRLFALKFVIHMVGDVHQPLHVASGDDKGGNSIRVTYHFNPSARLSVDSTSRNLHAVWDDAIIAEMISELSSASPQLRGTVQTDDDWKLLSDSLVQKAKSEWSSNFTGWRQSIAESQSEPALRTALTAIAGETATAGCDFAYVFPDGTRIQSGDSLDESYYQRSKPITAAQLTKGGARLAQLLEDSLKGARKEEALVV